MPEPLTLSQPAWALLDMLQQQLDVSVEVLDPSLRPLIPSGGDVSSALDQPGVKGEIQKSLRTGEVRIDRTGGVPVGIFPLRVAREIAGVLIVARRSQRPDTPVPAETNIDRAGHLARLALESDVGLTRQLTDARHSMRRAHGILRFLSQLGAFPSERDLMNAVIQAAVVWFDVDCRIYQRQPDGAFQFAATLPGLEQKPSGARIERARAEKLVASHRFASGGDLEDLGLAGRRAEVLVLPVGPSPEWLLILAGAIDREIELTFAAIARMVAAELLAREVARLDLWQQRLAGLSDDKRRAPERTLLKLLEALAADAGATSARVTLVTDEGERVLAALGPLAPAEEPTSAEAPSGAARPADEHIATIAIAPEASVRVTIDAPGAGRVAAVQLSSWLKALQPWLREAAAGLASQASLFDVAVEVSSFERRIQEEIERARRFNLGLGLVVIGAADKTPGALPMEPVVSALRAELRASDLMGRIHSGQVAVLLVHAEPVGADSVAGRLRERLQMLSHDATLTAVQLGRATFSPEIASADSFISQALREVQIIPLN